MTRARQDLMPETDPVPVPAPEPEDPPGVLSRGSRRLIQRLTKQCASDQVLAQTVGAFLDDPHWTEEDGGVETEAAPRYLRLSADEITIGHVSFSGTTRIALMRDR